MTTRSTLEQAMLFWFKTKNYKEMDVEFLVKELLRYLYGHRLLKKEEPK